MSTFICYSDSVPNRIFLLYYVTSGSEITPCNKIDKPLVVYLYSGNLKKLHFRADLTVFTARIRNEYGTVKPVLRGHSKRRPKTVFRTHYRLMQVKSVADSAKLLTFIKLPFVMGAQWLSGSA